MREIFAILPVPIRSLVEAMPAAVCEQLEEIRLRLGQPMEVRFGQQSGFVTATGQLTANVRQGWVLKEELFVTMLNQISQHSLYAFEEELKRGFLTIVGGHRIGISGKVLLEKSEVVGIRDIASLNIRIAREKKGVAKQMLPYLFHQSRVLNTLIISPPQCGKTTLLRDIARSLSYGSEWSSSRKVAIVDERSELAGSIRGVPQRDVGPRTDVLDACPKAIGIMMMIRSMSPDVVIADEIGRFEDGEAIWEAIHAGVSVVCSAHAADVEEVSRRPALGKLMQHGAFARYIVLDRSQGAGTVQGIYDDSFVNLAKGTVAWSN